MDEIELASYLRDYFHVFYHKAKIVHGMVWVTLLMVTLGFVNMVTDKLRIVVTLFSNHTLELW